jgi:hypothetical protein
MAMACCALTAPTARQITAAVPAITPTAML